MLNNLEPSDNPQLHNCKFVNFCVSSVNKDDCISPWKICVKIKKYRQILSKSSSIGIFKFECSDAWLLKDKKSLEHLKNFLYCNRMVTWEQVQWQLWNNTIYVSQAQRLLLHNTWQTFYQVSTPNTTAKYKCGNYWRTLENAITCFIYTLNKSRYLTLQLNVHLMTSLKDQAL